MTLDRTPATHPEDGSRSHRAAFTVTVASRTDGHYLSREDFFVHVVGWLRDGLKGRHAIAEVTIAAADEVQQSDTLAALDGTDSEHTDDVRNSMAQQAMDLQAAVQQFAAEIIHGGPYAGRARSIAESATALAMQAAACDATGDLDLYGVPVSARPCGECSHPSHAHREGEDPVTPGVCLQCEAEGSEDDVHHDYRSNA